MTTLPRCKNCGQPLAITQDAETYCPDCLSFRPVFATFGDWLTAVDEAIIRRVGVSSADLPDQTYADWYEAGMTPAEAAEEAIEDSMA